MPLSELSTRQARFRARRLSRLTRLQRRLVVALARCLAKQIVEAEIAIRVAAEEARRAELGTIFNRLRDSGFSVERAALVIGRPKSTPFRWGQGARRARETAGGHPGTPSSPRRAITELPAIAEGSGA